MKINEVNIRILNIPKIPDYLFSPTLAIPKAPPVTTIIGTPIVDIPGCVEAYNTNSSNKNLIKDDPNGVVTLCDSNFPSFNPLHFNPEQIIPTRPSRVLKTPESKGGISLPVVPNKSPSVPINIECPTPSQKIEEPLGTYIQEYRKKIIEYKLIGNKCIQITEDVGIPEQVVAGLPSSGQVMSAAGITVVATTAAVFAKPLSKILMRLIKPIVKKVIKKISTLKGEAPLRLSVSERRKIQREKN